MDGFCPHCDPPDVLLLRLVLLCEIFRADDTMIARIADIFRALGLWELPEEVGDPTPLRVHTRPPHLRLVK